MRSRFSRRALVLSWIFILGAGFLILRLYFVQIVNGDKYERDALGQYREASPDTENRSDIFFKKKDGGLVAAAVMQTGWRIAIQPKNLTGANEMYEKLNAVLPVDKERFFASAGKENDPYEEIAFRVSDSEAVAVRKLKIPGVILVQDRWRMYPAATLAAHAIGFVGYQGNKKVGVYGLERYYEDLLSRASTGLYVNPFAEIFTSIESLLAKDPRMEEGDIITSIEPSVEQNLESVLEDIQKAYEPKLAGGIIMNPRTGEIIAMAARPDFNPNTYSTVADHSVFGNPLVEALYEMGSIMKPLTLAAAIDAGAITAGTTYNDKGFIMKSGKKISNFDGKARGVVSMQEVLNQSLNTGASFAEERMGHDAFAKYMYSYGLGEETGIDLPNEVAGNIRAIERGVDVDYASASFGQGIAVTPIGMIRALGALANSGLLPEPHIAAAVRYESGIVRNVTTPTQKRVLKPETVETMATMLTEVYDKALLNGELKQEHYSIAAKTGTAQIGIPGGGGYYEDRFLHAFFGFFPSHDPKFIVFLYAVEPKKEIYASHTLAKPFLEIAKFLINYYNISPDR
ncbi:MAG TPA: penicillin-binding protein 2 [Candidatus Paceibacterota bacterium]|nr:penicillin-binding protein 2 [Candidatus Paceibacterota bacterium]